MNYIFMLLVESARPSVSFSICVSSISEKPAEAQEQHHQEHVRCDHPKVSWTGLEGR